MNYSKSEYLLLQKFGIRNNIKMNEGISVQMFNFVVSAIEQKKKKLSSRNSKQSYLKDSHLFEMIPSEISIDKKVIERFHVEIPILGPVSEKELSWIVKKIAQRLMINK